MKPVQPETGNYLHAVGQRNSLIDIRTGIDFIDIAVFIPFQRFCAV